MKKNIFSIGILLVLLLLLFGCGNSNNGMNAADFDPTVYETVNNLEGVSMNVVEDTVSSTGLTVLLANDTDKEIIYSEDFVLETKIDDSWYQVPTVLEENYGFNDIGFQVQPKSSAEWSVDWEWLHGSLENGEYRIVKKVLDFRGPGDFDEYHLAATFVLDDME